MVDLMLDALASDKTDELDDLAIIATAFNIFFVGSTAVTQSLTNACFELAQKPEIQDKLRVYMICLH